MCLGELREHHGSQGTDSSFLQVAAMSRVPQGPPLGQTSYKSPEFHHWALHWDAGHQTVLSAPSQFRYIYFPYKICLSMKRGQCYRAVGTHVMHSASNNSFLHLCYIFSAFLE